VLTLGSASNRPPFTLNWSHYVFLVGLSNPDERGFYEVESTNNGWSLAELRRQFDSSLYERLALSRDKEMYVNYYDRFVKIAGESPTVGMILCKQNHKAMVEITLPEGSNVHAREYKLVLPSKADLRRKLLEWTGEGVS